MLGAKHSLADRQRIAIKRRSLRVSQASMEIIACPVQKFGPVYSRRRFVETRGLSGEEMRRELGAQRRGFQIFVTVARINGREPYNNALSGGLRQSLCFRACACYRLNEAMHGDCLCTVVEWIVLHERYFGERSERLQPLTLIVNCARDQEHRDALGRTLCQESHQRFGRGEL